MSKRSWLPLLAVALPLAGCTLPFADLPETEAECTPGDEGFCRCEDGISSYRSCDAAGTWGECVCWEECEPGERRACECDIDSDSTPKV